MPEENWLPLKRGEYAIDELLRLDVPYLEKFNSWTAPKADLIDEEAA